MEYAPPMPYFVMFQQYFLYPTTVFKKSDPSSSLILVSPVVGSSASFSFVLLCSLLRGGGGWKLCPYLDLAPHSAE